MPSLTQLRYVLAVHRHGHFGKAAEACHVSQPTLSGQIQKTEEELGFPIFARDSKPVGLTDKGKALIEPAYEVVSAHERLLRLAEAQFEKLAGELTLGIIPTLAAYVTPWFIKPFAENYPLIHLNVLERTTEGILLDIGSRRMDAAIVATPLEVATVEERVLFYDPFYLYANRAEAVLDQDEVDPAGLDPNKLWLLQDGHCVRTQALAVCDLVEGCSHLSSVRFEAGSFETLRHLIDASEGYTIVPETYVRLLPRDRRLQQVRPLTEPAPTREISLVHPTNSWKTDLVAALETMIRARIPRALRHASSPGEVLPVLKPVREEGRRRKGRRGPRATPASGR